MNRNKKLLDSFVKYCNQYPDQRFWQALRNWSGFAFIYATDRLTEVEGLKDTFYWENKNTH